MKNLGTTWSPKIHQKNTNIQEGEKLIKPITIKRLIKVRKEPLSQLEGSFPWKAAAKLWVGAGRGGGGQI